MPSRCHYCGRVVRSGSVMTRALSTAALALRRAAAAGIAVCPEHRELVLVDPVHHPYIRTWSGKDA